MNDQYLCRDCGLEMELIQQGLTAGHILNVVTCKNRSCALWSVTLSTEQYARLTEAEWQVYRESVARLKKTLRIGE